MKHHIIPGTSYAEKILTHLPIGVALFDAHDLLLLAANHAFHTFLDANWQQGEALGHHITEFLPHVERSGSINIFRQVVETGVPYQMKAYASAIYAATRGITYWDWSVTPIRDQEDHVDQLLMTLTDVTEQVLAQQQGERARSALEVEQQRLTLLEAMARRVGEMYRLKDIATTALDVINEYLHPTSVVLYRNDATRQCLRALALALPKEFRSQEERSLARIPYDAPSLLIQMLQREQPLLSTTPLTNKSQQVPEGLLQAIPGTRTLFWLPLRYKNFCEGVLVVSFEQELQLSAPQMQALEGCMETLAEALSRARLHATIEREQQRFLTILDQLPEGVLLVEAISGTISYANSAASSLLMVPQKNLIGAQLNQLALSSVATGSLQSSTVPWNFALIHALGGKTIRSQELVLRRPGGDEAILLSSAAPIRMEDGLIAEAVIAFQDITMQKTIERQKSAFLTMVNHELRTPLTSVLGFSDLLRMHGTDGLSSLQSYAITNIAEQSECLKYLVDEILDQSHFEHAVFALNVRYQDLFPALKQAAERYSRTSDKHHIQFNIEDLPADIQLMGWFDQQRIVQALDNLLTNAIKYSPADSMIELGARLYAEAGAASQNLLLWVKDQGPGIAPEDLPHIFERFYRGQKRDQLVSGLGLGLYLAKEFVQHHRGRIWAESTEGAGSTFFLTLPL